LGYVYAGLAKYLKIQVLIVRKADHHSDIQPVAVVLAVGWSYGLTYEAL